MPENKSNGFNHKDILSSLTTDILRIRSDKKTDKIDNALSNVSDSILNKDVNNYADLIRRTFSSIIDKNSGSLSKGKLDARFFQDYLEKNRLHRYDNADNIVDSISYCSRALDVISDEVTSPDDITKEIIRFYNEEDSSATAKEEMTNVKNINKHLEVEKYIRDVVSDTLKFGDQFVEICDYTDDDIPLSQVVLTEDGNLSDINKDKRLKGKPVSEIMEHVQQKEINFYDLKEEEIEEETNSETFLVESLGSNDKISSFVNDHDMSRSIKIRPMIVEAKKTNGSRRNVDNLNNVKVIIHDPRYVIKLQSSRFKMCLGYLVLPKIGSSGGFGGYSNRTGRVSPLLARHSSSQALMGVDALYADIMKMIKKHINDKEFEVNNTEVKDMISRSLKEFEGNKELDYKIRYIPTERMEHFNINNSKFFPYGEGIFYKITFAAKLLIALETAITIKRLSDSTDKRIMYIETGTPRNVKDIINQVKDSMKKRKISLDKLGNIGSIPTMLTNYEELYIPQNNGKRYIDFDRLDSPFQIRDVTEELKFFRDYLVAGLNVPPSFIGLEENLSNKSALSFESILFARTINSYQTAFSVPLRNLFNKLHKFIYGEGLRSDIRISFAPPKMLKLERESEYIRMVVDIINSLSDLGINKKYLVKKYLPFDWDKMEEEEIDAILDKNIETDEEQGGGLGY